MKLTVLCSRIKLIIASGLGWAGLGWAGLGWLFPTNYNEIKHFPYKVHWRTATGQASVGWAKPFEFEYRCMYVCTYV